MLPVKCGGPFTLHSPSDPRTVKSAVDGAILSERKKRMHSGESSTRVEPGPYLAISLDTCLHPLILSFLQYFKIEADVFPVELVKG